MSTTSSARTKRERDLDALLAHIRQVRDLLKSSKEHGASSARTALEQVGLAQQALEKARDDVSALKRNTFDKEQADRLAEELQQSQGSYAAEHSKYVALLESMQSLRHQADTTEAEQAKVRQLTAEVAHLRDERDQAAIEYHQAVEPLMKTSLLAAIANHGSPELIPASRNPMPTIAQIEALRDCHPPVLTPHLCAELIYAVRNAHAFKAARNHIAHPSGVTDSGRRSSYATMAEQLDRTPHRAALGWAQTIPLLEDKKSLASARLAQLGARGLESVDYNEADYDHEGVYRPRLLGPPGGPRPNPLSTSGIRSSHSGSRGTPSVANSRYAHFAGDRVGQPWGNLASDGFDSGDHHGQARKRRRAGSARESATTASVQSEAAFSHGSPKGLFSYDDEE